MRKKLKGIDTIILNIDKYGGITSIDADKLTRKMGDVFPNSDFTELSSDLGVPIVALQNMTMIAVIKLDAAKSDKMGWKKHRKTLKDDGFDA